MSFGNPRWGPTGVYDPQTLYQIAIEIQRVWSCLPTREALNGTDSDQYASRFTKRLVKTTPSLTPQLTLNERPVQQLRSERPNYPTFQVKYQYTRSSRQLT